MRSLKKFLAAASAIAVLLNPSLIGGFDAISANEITNASTTETPEQTGNEASPQGTATVSSTETTASFETATTTAVAPPVKDLSAPILNVSIKYQNEWRNKIEYGDWEVSASEGASIYYELSDEKFDDTNEMPASLEKWEGPDKLPEGSHYIRFLASYDDEDRPKAVSENDLHYQLDKTSPDDFTLSSEVNKINDYYYELVIKNDSAITDDYSGIKEIFYTINEDPNLPLDYQKISVPFTKIDESGKSVNISFTINNSIKDAAVKVYVCDNAGNEPKTAALEIPDFVAQIPNITSVDIVNISYDDNDPQHNYPIETIQKPHEYGIEDTENHTNYIYANDNSYLRVRTNYHSNSLEIKVLLNGYKVIFNAEGLKSNSDIKKDGSVYYIPISNPAFNLDDSEIYDVSVAVSDESNTGNTVKLSDSFYYDTNGESDSEIDFSYKGNYIAKSGDSFKNPGLDNKYDMYFGETSSENNISVNVSDDVGIGEYHIIVNGETVKEEILYDGAVKKVEASDESENTEYYDKVTETEPYKISLDEDGEYIIEVIAIDLSGNKRVEKKSVKVDTSAPTVQGTRYDVQGVDSLHYVPFGIYGNAPISIKLNIHDDGCTLSPENVKLYWASNEDDTTLSEYSAKYVGEDYIFEGLSPNGKAVPYIKVTDAIGNEAVYYFQTVDSGDDFRTSSTLTTEAPENDVYLVLDSSAPVISVEPQGNYNGSLGTDSKEMYFGKVIDAPNALDVTVTDNEGLYQYTVSVFDSNDQTVYEAVTYDLSEGADAAILSNKDGSIADDKNKFAPIVLDDLASGKYTLHISAVDLAGNTVGSDHVFYIDTTAPMIDGPKYEVTDSILRYFTFGIFGKTTISISVDIHDDDTGCGIKDAALYWAGEDSDKLVKYGYSEKNGKYTFSGLPINCEAVPYFEVEDKMGNSNIYYFTTVDSGIKEDNIGDLILSDKTSNITLVLENDKPETEIFVPDDYSGYSVGGEIWYPGDIEYHVTAIDSNSGLNVVSVKQNDGQPFDLTKYDDHDFIAERFQRKAEYIYPLTEANDYSIVVNSTDNAGNKSDDKILKFHIDKEAPQITMFRFGDKVDNGSVTVKTTYGFYFRNETEARVYVNDPGITSGLDQVTLFLSYVDGRKNTTTVSGFDLRSDESGTYALFTIPMGFKGSVAAEVTDNVEHSSGMINADGNIIENNEIHQNAATLDIHENIATDKHDAKNIPLYNQSIPLTITAKDTFSGIAKIEWSISNDNKSGTITVDNDGTYHSDSQDITIALAERESNLITSIRFAVTVNSNTNENTVKIKLTDRSGNTSELSKAYSIDTTTPTISAAFGNTNVQNGSYYKDPQTVNIVITERNFNGSDVQVKLNGAVQQITWNDNGETVGQDSTEHRASFNISADGDYTYEISYTDRAGNAAAPITSSQFTIDTTDPEADISFDSGDKNLKDAYYNKDRTVTFNVAEHNYSDAAIHIIKDGIDVSGNYDLSNWEPEDHSGDDHTQSVVLSEDGYYVVSIDVTDKSGRTVNRRSNGFYIDKNAPVVGIEIQNVANGSPSNDEIITPVVSVKDMEGNLDPETITLSVTAIKLNADHEIVPDIKKYIGLEEWQKADIGTVTVDEETDPNTITFNFNNVEDDGIYTFEVTASDKAGNTGGDSQEDKNNGAKYKISINRLGSTYEVDAKIAEVDPDLRYFRNKEDTPFSFTITEYNVNQLKPDNTIVKMTCDGTVVENEVTAVEDVGEDKWSKYTYEFPSELMNNSGKYIVKLYSEDEAGNENPLEVNGEDERATVTFFIDNDDPTVSFRDADDKTEFIDKANYRTDRKHIEVEVYDNSQQEARNVTFNLDGEDITAEVQHDPGTMIYTLTLPGKSSAQELSVSLEDIAGNHMETGVEDFLITTNLFILWFSNTPLFIGSIAAVLLAIIGIIVLIIKKKNDRSRF